MTSLKKRLQRIERAEGQRSLSFVMTPDQYEALMAGSPDAPDLSQFTKRFAVIPRPCETTEEWEEKYARPMREKEAKETLQLAHKSANGSNDHDS